MALTDVAVRNAKPKDKPYKMADAGGLFLFVTPSGGKLWRLKYRLNGTEKLLSFGAYPALSLAEARERRDESKKHLVRGADPSEKRKDSKRAANEAMGHTFRLLSEEYLAKIRADGREDSTLSKNRWLLQDLASALAERPISQITAPEVLEVLRRVEARGALDTAQRLRSAIGRIFRYAIATGRASNDPTFALRGALRTPQVKHRAAITDPAQVGQLLRAIDGLNGSMVVRVALQLLALHFSRPGDLRHAEWSEFDLDKAIWSIPARRDGAGASTKMREADEVPLAPQVVRILRQLKDVTGHRRLVLPGVRDPNRPLSENTFNAALRRCGYTKDDMCAHGFRTVASTLLNESGKWNPDAIERALGHQERNKVRRAYARGKYWDERVAMAAAWADYLDELRLMKPPEGRQ